jgi:hypothetical protein
MDVETARRSASACDMASSIDLITRGESWLQEEEFVVALESVECMMGCKVETRTAYAMERQSDMEEDGLRKAAKYYPTSYRLPASGST